MSTGKIVKIKKSRKPKKPKKLYFGPDVDLAIVRYNDCEDPHERSTIYNNHIKYAFDKLAENILHTFKFYYTDGQDLKSVQHDVVSFLMEKLPKFTQGKGKAFSYFSIIAKNFCILRNNKNYKKLVASTDAVLVDDEISIAVAASTPCLEKFFNQYVDYWDNNLHKHFSKEKERAVAMAIVELFRRRENIDIFNKKALYVYIREMSNGSTSQITKVMKIMKEKYLKIFSAYAELDFVPHDRTY